jgi:hypothetical protein
MHGSFFKAGINIMHYAFCIVQLLQKCTWLGTQDSTAHQPVSSEAALGINTTASVATFCPQYCCPMSWTILVVPLHNYQPRATVLLCCCRSACYFAAPLLQLPLGNLSGATQATILQLLQPFLNSITARAASGTRGAARGLLQDDSAEGEAGFNFTLEYYTQLVDSQIRPALEAEGIDNATISQLVNSTAAFLFSLEGLNGDVDFAARAAQVG